MKVLVSTFNKEEALVEAFSEYYRVSQKSVYTFVFVISQLLDKVQRKFGQFFNSPGDADSKTDLTFLLT